MLVGHAGEGWAGRLTWVGWVARALEDLLQAQEVLLALAAWVAEVLPAPKLGKLH